MSEWLVQVIQLGKIGKHRNADTLSVTQVKGAYPVVLKTGDFAPGDLAVHIPPDSLCPINRPEFSWLKESSNGLHRVRYTKLRGVPSFGFLVPVAGNPALEGVVRPGDLVHEKLGVTKYEPPQAFQLEGHGWMVGFHGQDMIPTYDIEGLRKYEQLFHTGEHVWCSEKIHGTNGRWVYLDGKLRCGSRNKFREDSIWNSQAELYGLDRILRREENQGRVLYGEVYGPGVQDLTYGVPKPETRFFDIFDTKTGRWLNQDQFRQWCEQYELPTVPTLYAGPFNLELMYRLAEGPSTLPGADHVREGVVVKPYEERWDQEIGRVFLKLPGEGYLLRKEKAITQ